jgi:hypothetical protein
MITKVINAGLLVWFGCKDHSLEMSRGGKVPKGVRHILSMMHFGILTKCASSIFTGE